jgi:hypothetical protein
MVVSCFFPFKINNIIPLRDGNYMKELLADGFIDAIFAQGGN